MTIKQTPTPHGGMHVSVQPMAGRSISKTSTPAKEHPAGKGSFGAMLMDDRDLSKIEPQWSGKKPGENLIQSARLSKPTFDELFGQK